ncbi:hypothetical protein ACQR13_20930 [Bradyrhizobium sp. HKCCYLRH3059]
MKLLVADLFCGAGGTSTGLARAIAALGLAWRSSAVRWTGWGRSAS